MLVVIAVAVFVVIIVIRVLDDNFITSVRVSGEVYHDRHDFVLGIIIVRYNLYRGHLLDNLHLLNWCLDNLLHSHHPRLQTFPGTTPVYGWTQHSSWGNYCFAPVEPDLIPVCCCHCMPQQKGVLRLCWRRGHCLGRCPTP